MSLGFSSPIKHQGDPLPLPDRCALLVHHPLWILRGEGVVGKKQYNRALHFMLDMKKIGVFTIYLAYTQHVDMNFLTMCDYFIFQLTGSSKKLKRKDIRWEYATSGGAGKSVSEKHKGYIEERIKNKTGIIVRSHVVLAQALAKKLEKEFGIGGIDYLYVIGGPVEGCMPHNIDSIKRNTRYLGLDLKLIYDLVVREHPSTNPYKILPWGLFAKKSAKGIFFTLVRNAGIEHKN